MLREPCREGHAERTTLRGPMLRGPCHEGHTERVIPKVSCRKGRVLKIILPFPTSLKGLQSKGIFILHLMPMIDSKSFISVNHTKAKESIVEGYSKVFSYIYPINMRR